MYKVDKEIDHISTMQMRLLWMAYLAFLFFILYGSVNQQVSLASHYSSLVFEWEKNIPFIEEWILPYIAIYPLFVVAFILPQSNLELRVLVLRSFAIIIFSVLVFLFFPLEFSFIRPQTENFSWFVESVNLLDLPYNQAPSLHVSFSVVLWFSLAKRFHLWWIKLLLALLFFTIAISTLFVYQHHFIDVITGVLVGLLSGYLIDEKSKIRVLRSLSRAKDLKRALWYLLASLVAVVLYFHLAWVFGFLFFYLVWISVGSAFGLRYQR
jgi:membrane-associated phospholipid phosphatase